MKIIVMLTVLSLGASQDVEVNAPQELAQQDPSINQQAPAKGADYLVSDEEYTASRGVASASVASSPPQQIQPVQGYGNAPVISASYGIAAPVQSYGSAVVPPVPNSRPLPVPESGGYASAAIVAPAPAVPPAMPMPYAFQYAVKDEAIDLNFGHSVSSDGTVVTGTYYVLLPDGRLQTVNYQADDDGYVAQVTYDDDDDDDENPSRLQAFSQQQATGNQQSQQLQSGGYGVPVPVPTAAPRPAVNAPPPVSAYSIPPPTPAVTVSAGPSVPVRTSTGPASAPTAPATPQASPQPGQVAYSISPPIPTETVSAGPSVPVAQTQPAQVQQGAVLTVQTAQLPQAQVSSTVTVQNLSQPGAALTVQLSSAAQPASQQNTQQTPAAAIPATQAPLSSTQTLNREQNSEQGAPQAVPPAPPASQTNSQIFVADPTSGKPGKPSPAATTRPALTATTGQQAQAQVPIQPNNQVTATAPRQPAPNPSLPVQISQAGSAGSQSAATARPAAPGARPAAAPPTQTASAAPSASLGLWQLQLCASCPSRFPPEASAQNHPPAPVTVQVQQTPSITPSPTPGARLNSRPAQTWSPGVPAGSPADAYNVPEPQTDF